MTRSNRSSFRVHWWLLAVLLPGLLGLSTAGATASTADWRASVQALAGKPVTGTSTRYLTRLKIPFVIHSPS